MPGVRIPGSRYFAILTGLLAVFVSPCGSLGGQTPTNDKTPAGTQNQAPFQLKVASNLVVVRVVVRDAQGKPVEGLQKEDFKLFDRGKEQTITQFEVEASVAPTSSSVAVHAPGQAAPPPPPAMPGKFLALYFDDLNTSDADMMQARDAADHYIAANLHPKDRVAIFSSGKRLSDFTADPKQIHDALSKLHASARALTRVRECPDLSDYQALQITKFEDDQTIDEWKVALDEAVNRCQMPTDVATRMIPILARNIVEQAESQARTSLQVLERMVQYMSQMPGQRTIILVSPGFMSQSEQYQLDRIIDRALRSQVVISSLDPKGLALLMRESDITRGYNPSAASGVIGAMHSVDSSREFSATDVLAEVAQGTGGEFFHNNNDLKAGFGALAGSPVYYILAFAPADVKPDGKFHALKVTLAEKGKGITIQARRGYFAPKNAAEAEAEAKEIQASDAEAQAQEQIREAVLSKTESQQFSVVMGAKLSDGGGESRQLSLYAHLDAKPLHFHKDGEHNLNTVTFVFAIFDQKENLIMSQQRRARVSVLDVQLPELFKAGVDANMTFQLKPGIYRIREVVADSEEHHMTTFSKNVKIP
jgi:VWFA-related protein